MKLIPIQLANGVYNVPYPTAGNDSPLASYHEALLELYFGKDWKNIINLACDNWSCGTKDCICNKDGKCDCHNYTEPDVKDSEPCCSTCDNLNSDGKGPVCGDCKILYPEKTESKWQRTF